MSTVPFAKLAEIALAVMGQAQVKADDETLAMVQGARTFLRGVAQGQLIVGPLPEVPPKAPPTPKRQLPARGSEGVAGPER